ncbi:MAG: hypothetical protein CO128_01180 [Ignavibacteriales bacterium CG_4_9_14_3_um_filter_30_11]|nr:MAG: hypothetical protein CO128_01180 [Ignavibacteriales bacterium CG_4_9_14_3_um_filter_30_11]
MKFKDENIVRLISENAAKEQGFFLIDFIYRGTPKKRVLEIFIDGKDNVSADVCASVSRNITEKLNEIINENDDYKLIVSSPGSEYSLKIIDQFYKHIGRNLDVVYEENGEKKKLKGTLKNILNNDLFFDQNKTEIKINFNNIKKAKVIFSFSPKG